MTDPDIIQAPKRHRLGYTPNYSIFEIISAYIFAIIINLALVAASPGLLLIIYPLTGVVLNRFVLRRVYLWRQSNNITAVAKSNARMLLLWPLILPTFIFWLTLAKLF